MLFRITYLLLFLFSYTLTAKTIYVNGRFAGAEGDGSSWSSPIKSIPTAIALAAAEDQIWVAVGTYMAPNDVITQGFYVSKPLSFYGGFTGTETSLFERDLVNNKTLLVGDTSAGYERAIIFSLDKNTPLTIDGFDMTAFGYGVIHHYPNGEKNIVYAADDKYELNISNCNIYNGRSPVTFEYLSKVSIDKAIFRNNRKITIKVIEDLLIQLASANTSPSICIIENCSVNGYRDAFLDISSISLNIVNTTFSENTYQGFLIYNLQQNIFNHQFTNCNHVNNTSGFYTSVSNTIKASEPFVTSILACKFENNKIYDTSDLISIFGNEQLNIKTSSFLGNNYQALVNYHSLQSLIVSHSIFQNNISNLIASYPGSLSSILVNCKFLNNQASYGRSLIYLLSNFLEINNCDFELNNTSSTTIDRDFRGSSKINNSRFINNKSGNAGLFGSRDENLRIDSCKFSGNINSWMSGCISSFSKNLQILNSEFINNIGYRTGAVHCLGKNSFYNCKFINNQSTFNEGLSGAISVFSGELNVQSCLFESNSAIIIGAIQTNAYRNFINNSIFRNNSSSGDQPSAIALTDSECDMSISNSIFINNHSNNVNSLLNAVSTVDIPRYGSICNSTFVNNGFKSHGTRQIQASVLGRFATIKNCNFWNNSDDLIIPINDYYKPKISHSNIQGGYPGEGNTDVDPQFVDFEGGDYRLSCSSPLLNKGSNEFAPATPDLDGKPRIVGGTVDMGAYEFQLDPATVNAIPVPSFNLPAQGCRSQELVMENTSAPQTALNYEWDFGDSTLSREVNPKHRYLRAGTYQITLKASNGCGTSAVTTKSITILPSFVPSISFKEVVCPGAVSEFTTDAACSNLAWTVIGGSLQSGQGTSKILVLWGEGRSGNGQVILTATGCGAGFCEGPVTMEIPIVPVNFELQGKALACQGSTSDYETRVKDKAPATIFTWSVKAGSIIGNARGYDLHKVQVQWDAAATQGAVYLTTYNEMLKCGKTDSMQVSLRPALNITGTQAVCEQATTNYSLSQTLPAGSVQWSVSGTNVISETGTATWGSVPGKYNVIATLLQPGLACVSADTLVATLSSRPAIANLSGANEVLPGSGENYTATTANADLKWNWTARGGLVSASGANSLVTWGPAAPYRVEVSATSSATGCVSNVLGMDVFQKFPYVITGPSTICLGAPATFSLNSDVQTETEITWSQNNVPNPNNSLQLETTFLQPGQQKLTVSFIKNGKPDTYSKNVFVQASPSNITIRGPSTIDPAGTGTYNYTIENPSNLLFSYTTPGASTANLSGNTLTVTWDGIGPFQIRVIPSVAAPACPALPAILNVAKALPIATTIQSSGPACVNSKVKYTFAGDANTSKQVWNVSAGGTIISKAANEITVEWNTAGSQTVTLQYERYGAQTASLPVVVNELPVPVIADVTICGDRPLTISTTTAYTRYAWSTEAAATPFSTSAQPTVTAEGVYRVEVTDGNGCTSFSTKYVKQLPLPQVKLFSQSGFFFCTQPANTETPITIQTAEGQNYTYQWLKDGVEIAGATQANYVTTVATGAASQTRYRVRAAIESCTELSPEVVVQVQTCTGGGNPGPGTNPGGGTCTEPPVSFDVSTGCQPFTLTNTSASTDGFSWSFGDQTTSTLRDPGIKNYNTPGVYQIYLSRGCQNTMKQVEVPVVALFKVLTPGCSGQEIVFKDLSVSIPGRALQSWHWDFGDGTTLSQTINDPRDVRHTYATAGTYQVQLMVSALTAAGTVCNNAYSTSLSITNPPVASIIVTPPPCTDNLYQFAVSPLNQNANNKYNWSFGGTNVSSLAQPGVRFAPGNYTAQLELTDALGCKALSSAPITVATPFMVGKIQITGDTVLCEGNSVTLSAPSNFPGYWHLNGNFSYDHNSPITENSEGVWTLEGEEGDCSFSTPPVLITKYKLPSTTITGTPTPCSGNPITINTNLDPQKFSFSWSKDGLPYPGSGAALVIPEATPEDAGSYTATVKDLQHGCVVPLTPYVVTVNSSLAKPVVKASTRFVCTGGEVRLSSTGLSNTRTIEWYKDGILVPGSDSVLVVTNLTTNAYFSTKISEGGSGCVVESDKILITVTPPFTISLTGETNICENKSLSISSNLNTSDFDFQWYKDGLVYGGNNSKLSIAAVTFADAGTYFVTATQKQSGSITPCKTTSTPISVTIKAAPAKPAITGPSEFCTGNRIFLSTNLTYDFSWNNGSTFSSIPVTSGGTYSVTTKNIQSGCDATAAISVSENPLPDISFIPPGFFDRCPGDLITFEGLGGVPGLQWYQNGKAIATPNGLYAGAGGKYYLQAVTDKGCKASSDTMRIRPLDCPCLVTNTDDSGPGSLREAINCSNSKFGKDIIKFAIPGAGPHMIQPLSALPIFTDSVHVDGFTQAGANSYEIVLNGATYSRNAFSLLAGIGNSKFSGLTFSNYTNAIIFPSANANSIVEKNRFNAGKGNAIELQNNSSNNTISGNTIETSGMGVLISGGSNFIQIRANSITSSSVGIGVFSNSSGTLVYQNDILQATNQGIWLNGSSLSIIRKNTIGGCGGTAIQIEKGSTQTSIDSNYIGINTLGVGIPNSGNGILIDDTDFRSEVINNLIGNNQMNGVSISGAWTSVFRNSIGLDLSGSAAPNGQHGIFANSSSNIRANLVANNREYGVYTKSGSVIVSNTITNNNNGGVFVESGSNLLSRNLITNQNTLVKAIDLHFQSPPAGNDGKQPAVFTSYQKTANGILLFGTSLPEDSIEIFISSPQPEQAIKFVGSVFADANGTFQIEVNQRLANLDTTARNYFVNTATNAQRQTSELSPPYATSCDNCICLVTNVYDSGPGSLRGEIQNANNGACGIINFSITGPDTIRLGTPLDPLISKVTINGVKGTTGPNIYLKGTGAFVGLTLDTSKVNINNLGFTNFSTAIAVKGNNNLIDQVVVADTKLPISLSGNNNSIILSDFNPISTPGKASIADTIVYITGSNNKVGEVGKGNNISNGNAFGILVNGGVGNSLLYNAIVDNKAAIGHSNGGNTLHPRPNSLVATVAAGIHTINGQAKPGDKVQVFVSSNLPEQAYGFVVEVTADATGKWVATIPAALIQTTANTYFAATATSTQGNTSRLSRPVRFGNFVEVCLVTNTQDQGAGSLRAAVNCSNTSYGKDVIRFAIPGAGPHVVQPQSAFEALTDSVFIDGFSQGGMGNHQIILDGKSYAENAFTIDASLSDNRLQGITFRNYSTPIRLGTAVAKTTIEDNIILSNTGTAIELAGKGISNKILNNKITSQGNAIALGSNTNSTIIAGNKIDSALVGIEIISGGNNLITTNAILSSTLAGVRLLASVQNQIISNTIGGTKEHGIFVYGGSNENRIDSNFIGSSRTRTLLPNEGNGISIGNNSFGTLVRWNIIGNNGLNGIQSGSNGTRIQYNYIGVDRSGNSTPNQGSGILSDSSSVIVNTNVIANNGQFGAVLYTGSLASSNTFTNNKLGSIYATGAQNKITRNTFVNSNTGVKAIDLHLATLPAGNNAKSFATFSQYTKTPTGILLQGTSQPLDSIEVFVNNNLAQQALRFAGAARADATGAWKLLITEQPDVLDFASKNFYVNTATDAQGNTSELSDPLQISCYECVCKVTNTTDAGPGSLRGEIQNANTGGCFVINFGLTGPDTIVVATPLDPLQVPVSINGVRGTTEPAIFVKGNGTFTGLTLQADKANVNNLGFTNFSHGVIISSDSCMVEDLDVVKTRKPLTISGDYNKVLASGLNTLYNSASTYATDTIVYISGNSNKIGEAGKGNKIANGQSYGVLVDGGKLNSILYNTIVDNDTSIAHSRQGNSNYPRPDSLTAKVAAGIYTVSGQARTGDRVQIFTSSNVPEQAYRFVVETIADASGKWAAAIPASFIQPTVNTYFAATATSSQGNTSRLSRPVRFGNFVEVCLVINTQDQGAGSLRAAVNCSNTRYGKDVIKFAIPGTGPHVVQPQSAFELLTDSVFIDGFSQGGVGNHQIVLDGKNYAQNAFTFGLGLSESRLQGVTFQNYNIPIRLGAGVTRTVIGNNIIGANVGTAIELQDNTKNNSVENNKIASKGNAITLLSNATLNIVSGNTIDSARVGIEISNRSTANKIYRNDILQSSLHGVWIHNGSSVNRISTNSLGGAAQNGISITLNSAQTVIDSNIIGQNRLGAANGNDSCGIFVGIGCNTTNINANTIGNNGRHAVWTLGTNTTVAHNFLGVDQSGKANGNIGDGIHADTTSLLATQNTISNNGGFGIYASSQALARGNILSNNAKGGFYAHRQQNKITRNTFVNSNTGVKAIDLHLATLPAGNNAKPPATFSLYTKTPTGILLQGTSQPLDSIEIFVNNNLAQQALRFAGAARADATGAWQLLITEQQDVLDFASKNFYVNTATDAQGNTSELSDPLQISCYECICKVTNTTDAGPGSLRGEIQNANTGGCFVINFGLSGPDTIVVATSLDPLQVPVTINGVRGTTEPAIFVKGNGTFAGLTIQSDKANVNNLGFTNSSKGIILNADSCVLDQVDVVNSKLPLCITGDNNRVTTSGLNTWYNTSSTYLTDTIVYITGSNNKVGEEGKGNKIVNGQSFGVLVDGGKFNSILYNTIADNDTAIAHSRQGNNLHPKPDSLLAKITAGMYTVIGQAIAGDRVQVFVSSNVPEQAYQFVTETTSDATGKWTATIPTSFILPTANSYFAATATSAQGNTSRLSRPVRFGNFVEVCLVTNTQDQGAGSLRAAVNCSNTRYGKDVIKFAIPGAGAHVMQPQSAFEALTDSVFIDGFSQGGQGNHQIVLDGSSYSQNAFRFAARLADSRLQGVSFKNYSNAIVLSSGVTKIAIDDNVITENKATAIQLEADVSLTRISGNRIASIGNAITLQGNNTFNTINGNRIDSARIGVEILRGGNNAVRNNAILSASLHGLYISGSTQNQVISNTIGGAAQHGIYVLEGSAGTQIDSNMVGVDPQSAANANSGNGIHIAKNTAGTMLRRNIIGNNALHGIRNQTNGTIITENLIGVDKVGNAIPNQQSGVLADSTTLILSANHIANNGQFGAVLYAGSLARGNQFTNNKQGSVYATSAQNKITRNTFVNSNTGVKAIDLHLAALPAGNNAKPFATFSSYTKTPTGILLQGTSQPLDSIEVFVNNNLAQQALRFAGAARADATGAWQLLITEQQNVLDFASKNFYVNTAIDAQGNTSELSDPLQISCYECVCKVTNTTDAGPGSLRGEIQNANTGGCFVINFGLTGPDTIVVATPLDPLQVPVTINGVRGTTEPAIFVKGNGTFTGLAIQSDKANVNNLGFTNFSHGVIISSDSCTVDNLDVVKSRQPLTISGDNNKVVASGWNTMYNSASTYLTDTIVYITGSNNKIGEEGKGNKISNGQAYGVLVDGGKFNSILFNTIADNDTAIAHSRQGNNLHPKPDSLLGSILNNQATVTGRAMSGDKVQIFVSTNAPEQAYTFVNQVFADNSGNWISSIPANFIQAASNSYFVAVATDAAGNTSRLSLPVKVGTFPEVCLVTNTRDAGKGSLREAVACANVAGTGPQGVSTKILFNLPSVQNIIQPASGYVITNNFGVAINPGKSQVILRAANTSYNAFNWATRNLTIKNLSFENFKIALSGRGENAVIDSNKFFNNEQAINLVSPNPNSPQLITNNLVGGGQYGIRVNRGRIEITRNTIGITQDSSAAILIEIGIDISNADSVNISNNFIKNVQRPAAPNSLSAGLPIQVVDSRVFIIANKIYGGGVLTPVAVKLKGVRNSSFDKNMVSGAGIGFHADSSLVIWVAANKLEKVTEKGFDLTRTEQVQLYQNTVTGLIKGNKPIDLHLNTPLTSNYNKETPSIVSATYHHGKLHLQGKATPYDWMELYYTDADSTNLNTYVATVESDSVGNWQNSFVMAAEKANENFYCVTASKWNRTSEASMAFNPDLKLCVVTKTDDSGDGTLRDAITKANQNTCNVVLFNIPQPGVNQIVPTTALPEITGDKVTIDATSQNGFTKVVPTIELKNDNGQQRNGLAVYGTEQFCIYGIKLVGYDTSLVLSGVPRFEVAENTFHNFIQAGLSVRSASLDFGKILDNTVLTDRGTYGMYVRRSEGLVIDSNRISGFNLFGIYAGADKQKIAGNTIIGGNKFVAHGIYMIGGSFQVIQKNKILQGWRGIAHLGGTNNSVLQNFVGAMDSTQKANGLSVQETGIHIQNFKNGSIKDITVFGSANGITLQNSANTPVRNTTATNLTSTAVKIINSPGTPVTSSYFKSVGTGIDIVNSGQSFIYGNRMLGIGEYGVKVDALSDSCLIYTNSIGAEFLESTEYSNGIGVELSSSYNKVGGYKDSTGNHIFHNRKGGVVVKGGQHNLITYNVLFENDSTIGRPSAYAISLLNNGNTNKAKPEITTHRWSNGVFYLSGTNAAANDSIHVYLGKGGYEDARAFAGRALTDNAGNWEARIDSSQFKKMGSTQYVTATATDINLNTSPLSKIYIAGNCIVTSTADVADDEYPLPHSLRMAIKCANGQRERVGISFRIPEYGAKEIKLEKGLPALLNPYGINFNGRNQTYDKQVHGIEGSKIKGAVGIVIDTLLGPSTFDSLRVQNLSRGIVVGGDSATFNGMVFSGTDSIALQLTSTASHTLVANNIFFGKSTSQGISMQPGVKHTSVTNNTFQQLHTGIAASNVDSLLINKNTFGVIDSPVATGIQIEGSTNIVPRSNVFVLSDANHQAVICSNSTDIKLDSNTFNCNKSLHPFVMDSVTNFILHANTFAETAGTYVTLNNSAFGNIHRNEFLSADSHSIQAINSKKINVRQNYIASASNDAIDLIASSKILISRNIIVGVAANVNGDSAVCINIHKNQTALQANKGKQEPFNLGAAVKKASGRQALFVQGQATAGDSVEVYFSDSLSASMKKYLLTTHADSTGRWQMQIPRELYHQDTITWYHCLAVAIDPDSSTSQTSAVLHIKPTFNVLYVRNTYNAGPNSLRDALEQVAASDIYSRVLFKIDSAAFQPGPYRIMLDTALAPVYSYLGVVLDGKTQTSGKGDQRILIDAAKVTTSYALNLPDSSAKCEIKNLWIVNAQKGLLVYNEENKIQNLHFRIDTTGVKADSAVVVHGAGNSLQGISATGYHTAITIHNSNANTVEESVIDSANYGIVLTANASANVVRNNKIVRNQHTALLAREAGKGNLFQNNSIGSLAKPSLGYGLVIDNSSAQQVIGNKISYLNASASLPHAAAIFVHGNSDDNYFAKNVVGTDSTRLQAVRNNMVGIRVARTSTGSPEGNNFDKNQIVGTVGPAVHASRIVGAMFTENFIGTDSIGSRYGTDSTGMLLDSCESIKLTNNQILDFMSNGISLRWSDNISMSQNIINSAHTKGKAINLNAGTGMVSNQALLTPIIQTATLLDTQTVRVSGTRLRGTTVELFTSLRDTIHSTRYISEPDTSSGGTWSLNVPRKFFDFSKENCFVAQAHFNNRSSEYSQSYRSTPLLCQLDAIKPRIQLLDKTYQPCPDLPFTLRAGLDSALSFVWTSNSTKDTLRGQSIILKDTASNLRLTVTDKLGCKYSDTTDVLFKARPIYPDFLVSSNVYYGDTIMLIDVSKTLLTEYKWSSDLGVTIVSSGITDTLTGNDGKKYPEGRFVKFILPDSGAYTITQTSYRDGCLATLPRVIHANHKPPGTTNPYVVAPELESLSAYPNPSNGQPVKALVKVNTKDEVQLILSNLTGVEIYSKKLSGSQVYDVRLPDELIKGVYFLKLETKSKNIVFKVVLL